MGRYLALIPLLFSAPCEASSPAFQEIRVGIFLNDLNGSLKQGKEKGVPILAEYLFPAPTSFQWPPALSLHPHGGLLVNTSGKTHFGYGGLTLHAVLTETFFAEASVGLTLHTGGIQSATTRKKAYGSRALIQTGVAVGYLLSPNHTLSLSALHFSNGGLSSRNPGLTAVGLRYGYRL